MKVAIIHPAPPGIQTGNRVTADRWALLLRQLGCEVTLDQEWDGSPCDALIALHAGKSQPSIHRYHRAHPERPLVVAGTGTDIYGPGGASDEARSGLELASRVVVLQPNALDALPPEVRSKARVVYQSVDPPVRWSPPGSSRFDALVVANLRPVKDPLCAARAARLVGPGSRLRVLHAGGVLEAAVEAQVQEEIATNPRYTFLGLVDRSALLDRMANSHVVVNSSFNEGGANVVSEALAMGTPLLCSDIPGTTGLIGEEHPGLFQAGSELELSRLLERAESESGFLDDLARASRRRSPITEPERELQSWREILNL